MDTLRKVAYLRIHPFIGITIILIVTIFSVGILVATTPTAYGLSLSFGGSVDSFTQVCTKNVSPTDTTCTDSCDQGCGTFPIVCTKLSELTVGEQTYCPGQEFKWKGSGNPPRPGGAVVGVGIPMVPYGVLANTGTN